MQQIVPARKGCLGLKSLFCGPKRKEGILTLVGAHILEMTIQIRTLTSSCCCIQIRFALFHSLSKPSLSVSS